MNEPMNETIVTLEQWQSHRDRWQLAAEELIRLWYINKLGTQAELAKQMGYSTRTIKRFISKLRDAGQLEPLAETDGRKKGQNVLSDEQLQLRQEIIQSAREAINKIGEGISLMLMEGNMTVDEICAEMESCFPADMTRRGIANILNGETFISEQLIKYMASI